MSAYYSKIKATIALNPQSAHGLLTHWILIDKIFKRFPSDLLPKGWSLSERDVDFSARYVLRFLIDDIPAPEDAQTVLDIVNRFEAMPAPGYESLKQLLKEDDLKFDPWGCVMTAFFAAASELCWRGEDIPPEWGYDPGAAGDPRDLESSYYPDLEEAEAPELVKFGNLMHRYSIALKKQGKDY